MQSRELNNRKIPGLPAKNPRDDRTKNLIKAGIILTRTKGFQLELISTARQPVIEPQALIKCQRKPYRCL